MKPPKALHIGCLVLRGFAPAEAERVAAALRGGLERRLAGERPAVRAGDTGARAAEQLMQHVAAAPSRRRGGGS